MKPATLGSRALQAMFLAATFDLAFASIAQATWSDNGSGAASAAAYTMPTGQQPTARVAGNSVTLAWNAASFPNSQNVAGYVIRRVDAADGAQATVGAGCNGTVTVTTCTEQNVPSGDWTYTDTPVQDNWTGGQSPASAPVAVT
jgi:hypothetical protein